MIYFNKYKFRKYDKGYISLFLREKRKLIKILPKYSKIEHIGSTSVPELGGKGMIDIAVAISKDKIIKYKKILEKAGFVYKPKPKDNQRKYLEKRIVYKNKERRVHLHLTYDRSHIWKEFLIFRDCLRKNKELANNYAKVKKKALRYCKGNGKKYLLYKQPFIRKIIKKYSKS